ncbi:putative serine protease K12H4.7 [Orussus abietinus]|uniref:putative serine protease K12H4.7 n=1 Tax=Orussus abietinus TaxID=222816 RepID=UPI000626E127|nr:putative serine protease K12H4.7 [Orussus abietinus]
MNPVPAIFLLFLVAVERVHGFGFRGFTFEGIDVTGSLKSRPSPMSLSKEWITQPLDHFNHRDNRTWQMRYFENDEFFEGSGPILVMLGGEWAISWGFLSAGLMYDIAAENKALMYYTEHRYYGHSRPTLDTSVPNLQFLNVDQALADVAYFIEAKKRERNLKNGTVIVFGGSYAGNMAAWARLKYPHLIQGALASSAPVFAKADFFEYYQVVADSLGRYSQQCVRDVKSAFDSVEGLLSVEGGLKTLKKYFNLCKTPDVTVRNDLATFMVYLAEKFAAVVQFDGIVSRGTKISKICEDMTNVKLGSPLERLAKVARPTDECLEVDYKRFLEKFADVSWASPAAASSTRQWLYQTCTEYGYYQTSNSNRSIFGTLFPLEYFLDMCADLYGNYYDRPALEFGIERTNIMYGGWIPEVTNVIFTNGNVDPWHSLSILEDLNDSSPAIIVNGTSHCVDLMPDSDSDLEELTQARSKVREIIGRWIIS